jgi:TatD DNase family protein
MRISAKELMNRLEKNCKNQQVKAIGEIGLDKFATDYERQKSYFDMQINFAAQGHYPVILHQVKSVEGVGSVTKDFNEPIILHGFNGHISVWEQLNIKGKTYISIGSNCLNPSTKLLQTLKEIPINNLFLETDNAAVLVQTVYEKIASIRQIETSILMEEMAINFKSVFKTAI